MSLLVYALTAPSTRRLSTKGMTGERLHRIRVGSMQAIVGSVRAAPASTELNLRKYGRTMSALWRGATALLPVRFGTVVRDVAALEHLLEPQEAALRDRLRAVRRRSQMIVRVIPAPTPPQSPHAPVSPKPQATSGADYLRGRLRATREVPGFEPVRRAVKAWVREERVENRAGVGSVYHLVPSGSVTRYRKALEAAASDAELRVLVTGPWPPYAFAGEEI
jgi:hypothetical protein